MHAPRPLIIQITLTLSLAACLSILGGCMIGGRPNNPSPNSPSYATSAEKVWTRADTFLGGAYQRSYIDGPIATAGLINNVHSLTMLGNYVYFGDNACIRRIDKSTSAMTVTTVAGQCYYSGNSDGVGTQAKIGNPYGLATDGTLIYFADYTNHVIRSLSPSSGQVSIVAGSGVSGSADGDALSASFKTPYGLVYHAASSSLYIGDSTSYCVRKLDLSVSPAQVTTVAGLCGTSGNVNNAIGTTARFGSLRGMAVTGSLLYIVDVSGAAIRTIDLATAGYPVATLIKTFGSINTATSTINDNYYSSTNGPLSSAKVGLVDDLTIDPTGRYLYFSDSLSHLIREVDLTGQTVRTVVGAAHNPGLASGTGAAARIAQPGGLLYDSALGKIWATGENYAGWIGLVDPVASTYTTLNSSVEAAVNAGADRPMLYRPLAAITVGNTIYFTQEDHTIRKYDTTTRTLTTIAGVSGQSGHADGASTSALFNYPSGIVAIPSGGFFVADTWSHVIRHIKTDGTVVTVLGTVGTSASATCTNPVTVADGNAAVLCRPMGLVLDGTDLYIGQNTTIVKASFVDPGNGNQADFDRVNPAFTRVAGVSAGNVDGVGTVARFGGVKSMVKVGSNIYFSDNSQRSIRQMTVPGYTVTRIAGQGTTTPGYLDHATGTSALFYAPYALIADGNTLYSADATNQVIRKIDLATAGYPVTTVLGVQGGNSAAAIGYGTTGPLLSTPIALAQVSGSLFIFSQNAPSIARYNLNTRLFTYEVGSDENPYLGSVDGTAQPVRLAYNASVQAGDSLYVGGNSAFGGNVILKVARDGTAQTLTGSPLSAEAGQIDGNFSQARFMRIMGITATLDGSSLYTSDATTPTIRKIDLVHETVTTVAGNAEDRIVVNGVGLDARFGQPTHLAIDGTYLYISDKNQHAIRRMNLSTTEVSTLVGIPGVSGNADGTAATATLNLPDGLALVGGHLYVTDTGNYLIRKIDLTDPNNPVVSTVAGKAATPSTVGSSMDGIGTHAFLGGLTGKTSTDGRHIYFSQTYPSVIRRFTPATGQVLTIAGDVSGQFGVKDGLLLNEAILAPSSLSTAWGDLFVSSSSARALIRVH